MNNTINQNGIAQGMANIAQILAPDAGAMIQADVARNNVMNDRTRAQAATTNAAAAMANARVSQGNLKIAQNEDARTQTQFDAAQSLALAMGMSPDALATGLVQGGLVNSENMALLPTLMAALGVGTPDSLANTQIGAGAVPDFASTQPGHAIDAQTARMESADDLTAVQDTNATNVHVAGPDNASAELIQTLTNQNNLAVAGVEGQTSRAVADTNASATVDAAHIGADASNYAADAKLREMGFILDNPGAAIPDSKPATVSPSAGEDLRENIVGQIEAKYPGAYVASADIEAILADAAGIYQTSKNAPAAVQQAIENANLQESGTGWFDGNHQVAPTQPTAPPPGAIQKLQANPNMAAAFDQKYGQGASARVLGGQ